MSFQTSWKWLKVLSILISFFYLGPLPIADAHHNSLDHPWKLLQEHRHNILLLSSDPEALKFNQTFMPQQRQPQHSHTRRKSSRGRQTSHPIPRRDAKSHHQLLGCHGNYSICPGISVPYLKPHFPSIFLRKSSNQKHNANGSFQNLHYRNSRISWNSKKNCRRGQNKSPWLFLLTIIFLNLKKCITTSIQPLVGNHG